MEELLKKLAAIDASLEALLANDELTDDQRKEHDALQKDRAATQKAVERENSRLTREAEKAAFQAKLDADKAEREQLEADAKAETDRRATLALSRQARTLPASNRLTTPDLPGATAPVAIPLTQGAGRFTIPAQCRRHSPVLYFKDRPGQERPKEERAYRFGMFCLATLTRDMPNRYRFPEATEFVERHMAVGDHDAAGYQYLIPEEFGVDIVDLREYYGVFRRISRIMPMSSDSRTDPRRVAGLTANFYTMNASIPTSNKQWDNVRLDAKDLGIISVISNQVRMDNVVNWGDDLAFEIAYAFSQKEDQCGFIGDGTSTYGHIVGMGPKLQNCDNAGTASAGLVVQGTGSTWGAIVLNDFEIMTGKLPQYADVPGQVGWICHKTFFGTVMLKLLLASGGTMAYEIMDGFPNPVPKFLGYPVWFSQVMPATTATDTVSALLGNYKLGSRFGDRQQDAISFSEHATVGGVNLWENNQIGIRGTERFDINNHDVGTSAIVGPILGLATFH